MQVDRASMLTIEFVEINNDVKQSNQDIKEIRSSLDHLFKTVIKSKEKELKELKKQSKASRDSDKILEVKNFLEKLQNRRKSLKEIDRLDPYAAAEQISRVVEELEGDPSKVIRGLKEILNQRVESQERAVNLLRVKKKTNPHIDDTNVVEKLNNLKQLQNQLKKILPHELDKLSNLAKDLEHYPSNNIKLIHQIQKDISTIRSQRDVIKPHIENIKGFKNRVTMIQERLVKVSDRVSNVTTGLINQWNQDRESLKGKTQALYANKLHPLISSLKDHQLAFSCDATEINKRRVEEIQKKLTSLTNARDTVVKESQKKPKTALDQWQNVKQLRDDVEKEKPRVIKMLKDTLDLLNLDKQALWDNEKVQGLLEDLKPNDIASLSQKSFTELHEICHLWFERLQQTNSEFIIDGERYLKNPLPHYQEVYQSLQNTLYEVADLKESESLLNDLPKKARDEVATLFQSHRQGLVKLQSDLNGFEFSKIQQLETMNKDLDTMEKKLIPKDLKLSNITPEYMINVKNRMQKLLLSQEKSIQKLSKNPFSAQKEVNVIQDELLKIQKAISSPDEFYKDILLKLTAYLMDIKTKIPPDNAEALRRIDEHLRFLENAKQASFNVNNLPKLSSLEEILRVGEEYKQKMPEMNFFPTLPDTLRAKFESWKHLSTLRSTLVLNIQEVTRKYVENLLNTQKLLETWDPLHLLISPKKVEQQRKAHRALEQIYKDQTKAFNELGEILSKPVDSSKKAINKKIAEISAYNKKMISKKEAFEKILK